MTLGKSCNLQWGYGINRICYLWHTLGPLTGGSPCHLSILRNVNVACLCRLFIPMSPVEFKNDLSHVTMTLILMSHVEFKKHQCRPVTKSLCRMSNLKKRPCRPVDFKGQGPLLWPRPSILIAPELFLISIYIFA